MFANLKKQPLIGLAIAIATGILLTFLLLKILHIFYDLRLGLNDDIQYILLDIAILLILIILARYLFSRNVSPSFLNETATSSTFTAGGGLTAKRLTGEEIASQYASFTFTATTEIGSTVLTSVSSRANLASGQIVTGENLAPATVILIYAEVPSLSLPATGSGNGTLTVRGGPSTEGFTDALVATGPSGKVTLDYPYTIPNPPEASNVFTNGLQTRSQNYQQQQIITDRRPGWNRAYAYSSSFRTQLAATMFQHFHAINSSPEYGNSSWNSISLETSANAPGTMTYSDETVGTNILERMLSTQKGIHLNRSLEARKTGIGDFCIEAIYSKNWSGTTNIDDEGYKGGDLFLDEGNYREGSSTIPQALVTAGGMASDGTQFLRLNPTQLPGQFGGGRYAMLAKHADGADAELASLTVTSQVLVINPGNSYAQVAVTETISNISAVWGTGTAAFDVPYNFDLPQLITTTVAIAGGTQAATGFVAGIASMIGVWRKECVLVTAVKPVSGGQQTITFKVRDNVVGKNGQGIPPGPPMFMQEKGGLPTGFGQSLLKMTPYGPGMNSSSYPIMGAIDAHTLIVCTSMHAHEQGISNLTNLQPVPCPANLIRNSDGSVIIQLLGGGVGSNQIAPGMLVNVVAEDATYNVTQAPLSFFSPEVFSYQSGTNTPGNTSGTVIFNAGRNIGSVYRGCEVIRTLDPDVIPTPDAPDTVGNYIGLEPNNIPWAVGCLVESPSHYAALMTGTYTQLSSSTPVLSGSGHTVVLEGGIAKSGNVVSGSVLANYNPVTEYTGLGGFFSPPSGWKVTGVFDRIIDASAWTPMPNGDFIFLPFMNVGTEYSHVAWNIMRGVTATSSLAMQLDQSMDKFTISLGSLSIVLNLGSSFIAINGYAVFNTPPQAPAYVVNNGGVIASATHIAPTSSVFHVSGTTAIHDIGLTALFPYGSGVFYIIPDDAFTTVTGGNIHNAVTAVPGVPLMCVYDGVSIYIK